ncbi:MAG: pilus assembly protein [Anaerolineae bacterium]|nr:pilus assembly protein [Anaerolineae bacterium]
MNRRRGQGLVEFALVMPILLFMIMGIFDFSRLFITYAVTSNSLRTALRLAEVRGLDANNPQYANCGSMRGITSNVLFANAPTVTIFYRKASSPSTTYTCASGVNQYTPLSNIETGDMLNIRLQTNVRFITPFISNLWPSITLDMSGQRTIVQQVLLGTVAGAVADSDYDGLNDAWEISHFGNLNQAGTDDPDGDGCNNGCEETRNTDPLDSDTDNDGISDGDEVECGLDPNSPGSTADVDGDGLSAFTECALGLDDTIPDVDGDGLSDGYEYSTSNTNPTVPDTDGDGLTDGDEVNIHHTNPLAKDTDSDGLWDNAEVSRGTDPNDFDTDNDGLLDGEEVGYSDVTFTGWGTNPLNPDTDGDGLGDGYEVSINDTDFRTRDADDTDPTKADTDNDGLNDGREHLLLLTDPNDPDTDGDNLLDGEEITPTLVNPTCGFVLGPTDPLNPDTDGDTIQDDIDCANANDSDGDGLLDSWEITHFTTITLNIGTDDPDGDGCDNECEETRNLDPMHQDTDRDGLSDGREALPSIPGYTGTNPLNPDTDNDGVLDGDEIANGINPFNDDTDGDGLTDGQELYTAPPGPYTSGLGTNPNDPDSDADGLSDYAEVTINDLDPMTIDADDTDPKDSDTDNDGLSDGMEVNVWFTDPHDTDTDGDTLLDGGELTNGDTDAAIMDANDTDPTKWDTDGDGLSDADEFLVYFTNPRLVDSDGDGLDDYDELNFAALGYRVTANGVQGPVITAPLYPMDTDTDNDGVSDGDEVLILFTDPHNPDTDGDGLDDSDERVNSTNPLERDTDSDGFLDLEELTFGSSGYTITVEGVSVPITRNLNPTLADSDGDGLSDWVETHFAAQNYFVIVNNAAPGTQITTNLDPTGRDTDNDGVDDGPEVNTWHTNPLTRHTDNDTIEDGTEVNFAAQLYRVTVNGVQQPVITAPLIPTLDDSDGDGLNDNVELLERTHPLVADTDGDTLSDSFEVNFASRNYRVTVNGVEQAPINARLNPLMTSSDGDTLSDSNEIYTRFTNPLAADTDGDARNDNTDVYPLNQPTVTIACQSPANCQTSEPVNNNSPYTDQVIRIAAQYVNSGQSIQVAVTRSGSAITNSGTNVCSTSAARDAYRSGTHNGTVTFSANGFDDRSYRICADNATGEPATDDIINTIAPTGGNAAYIFISGPNSATAVITNR